MAITKKDIRRNSDAAAREAQYMAIPAIGAGATMGLGVMTGNPVIMTAAGVPMLANAVGFTAGALADTPSNKKMKEWEKSSYMAMIPGVSAYRNSQRHLAAVPTKAKKRRMNALGELLGTAALPILGAAIGGGIGRYMTDDGNYADMAVGTIGGGLLGALLGSVPNMVGATMAYIRKVRTNEEQRKHDDEENLMNFLVPGVGAYNTVQRYRNINTV